MSLDYYEPACVCSHGKGDHSDRHWSASENKWIWPCMIVRFRGTEDGPEEYCQCGDFTEALKEKAQ